MLSILAEIEPEALPPLGIHYVWSKVDPRDNPDDPANKYKKRTPSKYYYPDSDGVFRNLSTNEPTEGLLTPARELPEALLWWGLTWPDRPFRIDLWVKATDETPRRLLAMGATTQGRRVTETIF